MRRKKAPPSDGGRGCSFYKSVRDAPVDGVFGGLAAYCALVVEAFLLQRHAAGGHTALFLHLQLAFELAAPHCLDEAAVLSQIGRAHV